MKNYTYNLFPLLFVVIGYGFIGLTIYSAIFLIDYSDIEESSSAIAANLGFLAIGFILITLRSKFTIDSQSQLITKEYRVFGMKLSKDRIIIPRQAKEIIIVKKKKRGKGYYQAVIAFGYNLTSYDVFFDSDNGVVRIINTDYKRAVKIAELIKNELKLEYTIK